MQCTGLVARWHVGSSRTRARTRVPCVGRQTPNHCATREAQGFRSEMRRSQGFCLKVSNLSTEHEAKSSAEKEDLWGGVTGGLRIEESYQIIFAKEQMSLE